MKRFTLIWLKIYSNVPLQKSQCASDQHTAFLALKSNLNSVKERHEIQWDLNKECMCVRVCDPKHLSTESDSNCVLL